MMPITCASGSGSADPPRLSTPEWWFDEIVKKNLADFKINPTSFRHAFNALVTTYHFYERVWHYHRQQHSLEKVGCGFLQVTTDNLRPKDLKELKRKFRECLEEQCNDLRLLDGVANTVKHHIKEVGKFKGATATDMARRANGELRIFDAQNRDQGGTLEVLENAIQFWEKWLKANPSDEKGPDKR